MKNVAYLTQELEEEAETQKLIKTKSNDILTGLLNRVKNTKNEDALILAYLLEYISALIIRMDLLTDRIEELEDN